MRSMSSISSGSEMTHRSMMEADFYDVFVLEKDHVMVTEHDPVMLTEHHFDNFIKV